MGCRRRQATHPRVCMLKIAYSGLLNAQIARRAIWTSLWKLYFSSAAARRRPADPEATLASRKRPSSARRRRLNPARGPWCLSPGPRRGSGRRPPARPDDFRTEKPRQAGRWRADEPSSGELGGLGRASILASTSAIASATIRDTRPKPPPRPLSARSPPVTASDEAFPGMRGGRATPPPSFTPTCAYAKLSPAIVSESCPQS